tara:strand:+ start:185 stop:409 length:225 start_codon:yes stop_codon:yes gene_type:complete
MALNKKNIATTTFAVTFSLFMAEAIMHYNLGKKEADPEAKEGFLPPTKTFVKLGLIVAAFSVINGIIIKNITED